jgi:Cu/Ag efflux protein CusF
MTAKTTMLAVVIWLGAMALPFAQEPVSKTNVLRLNATIQAIDPATRFITLRDDKGNEDSFKVGDSVKRFDELKVGQRVNITYYESLVFHLVKPGETPGGTSFEAALTRAKSELPAGTLATQDKATVTVKAIDQAVPSISVTTADGREVTRKIENKKYLEGLKPGDKIDIVFTRALVTEVQNAN